MKRSFINLFMIIMILASLFASGIKVEPVEALGAMANVGLGLPTSWTSGSLRAVWGSSASDVYLVGQGTLSGSTLPLIYHGGGSTWLSSSPSLPTSWTSGPLVDVWGSSTSDVYAVGSGDVGTTTMPLVYHTTNGTTWNAVTPPLPTEPAGINRGNFNGVWGYGSYVYAVGSSQNSTSTLPLVAGSSNGVDWTPSALPGAGGPHSYLMDVWGSSSSDIYAVGYGEDASLNTVPLIYHSTNGTNWTRATLTLPTGWSFGSLYGVWGSSATDVYAVGVGRYGSADLPLLYHSTNQGGTWTWSSVGLPSGWTSAGLEKIWGANAADIYAVGFGTYGTDTVRPILYRKTTAGGWAASSPLPGSWYSGSFHSIWGATADDVYAAGSGNLNQGGNAMPLLEHAGPLADTVAPGAVTNLTATSGTSGGSVDLSWTAPADDGPNPPDPNLGPVESYIVKYSTSTLTDCSGGTAVTTGLPTPVTPGTTQTMTVTGLTVGTTYYFSVCARDEESNTSGAATTSTMVYAGAGIYDDTHPAWTYTGSWSQATTTGPYNGTDHYGNDSTATASFTFVGYGFALKYVKYSNRGNIEVWVDGVKVDTIYAYSSYLVWQATYTKSNLSNAVHTVVFKNGGPSGYYMDIDAIQVFAAVPAGIYDDTDPAWTYTGSWTPVTTTGPYNGTDHYTNSTASSASFTFIGTSFNFKYVTASNRGNIEVWVDGVKVDTINAYSSALTWQVTYTKSGLAGGVHTVVFKHGGPGGYFIDIDSIEIGP